MATDHDRRPVRLTAALVVLLIVGAASLVLFATGPRGAGLTIDSTSYLLAADMYERDLSDVGPVLNGVFPPGYSAAIALVDVAIDDLDRSAVAVNVIALSVVLALIGMGVWGAGAGADDGGEHRTGRLRRAVATVATVGFVASSTAMLRWTGAAMSEMLSLACIFGAMAVAARGVRSGRHANFVVAGLLSGAAALVRLVALGSVLGVAAAAFLLVGRSLRHRLTAGLTVLATGVVTSIVGVPLLASSNDSKRTIAWHPIDGDDVSEGLDTIAGYTLPSNISGDVARGLAVVVVGLMVAFVVLVVRAMISDDSRVPTISVLATTVGVAHVATVLGSMLLIDDLTPLDPRILLPVVPLFALAVGSAAAAADPVVSPRVVLAVGLVLVVGQFGRTVDWAGDMRRDGMGYAHTLFDDSETLRAVRAFPPDAEVFTNDVSLLYLRADLRAAQLPSDTDNYSRRATEDYDEMLDELGERLDSGAVVVYVDYFDFTTLPDADELEREIGPLDVTELSDGRVIRRAA